MKGFAIQPIKQRHHFTHFRIGKRIVDRLRFAPYADQVVMAQFGQMLGQRRLPDADGLLQGADAAFTFVQFAQDHQPMRIGQHLHQGGHVGCM